MARIRADYVFGVLNGGGIDIDDTTISSPQLARLPEVTGSDVAAMTLHDSDAGEYEIVHVTAHAAGATTATVLRGQEGSTAAIWAGGTPWVLGITQADVAEFLAGGTGSGVVATPTIRARTSGYSATVTGSSLVVTVPAATQAGDLLVLFIGGNTMPDSTAAVAPAGWSISAAPSSISWHASMVATKVATSTDAGTSVTFTMGGTEQADWYCLAVQDARSILAVGAIQIGPGGTGATTISTFVAAGGTASAVAMIAFASSRASSGAVALSGGTAIETRADSGARSGIFRPASPLPQKLTVTGPGAPGMGMAWVAIA